jgi:hypothetical protein
MSISDAMRAKAHEMIAADCLASYKAVNPPKRKRKRHVPYSVPQRAADLIAALDADDAERCAAILLYAAAPSRAER